MRFVRSVLLINWSYKHTLTWEICGTNSIVVLLLRNLAVEVVWQHLFEYPNRLHFRLEIILCFPPHLYISPNFYYVLARENGSYNGYWARAHRFSETALEERSEHQSHRSRTSSGGGALSISIWISIIQESRDTIKDPDMRDFSCTWTLPFFARDKQLLSINMSTFYVI